MFQSLARANIPLGHMLVVLLRQAHESSHSEELFHATDHHLCESMLTINGLVVTPSLHCH
jgi:hypothetical protein